MRSRAQLIMDQKAHCAMIPVFHEKFRMAIRDKNMNEAKQMREFCRYHIISAKIIRLQIRRGDW